MNLVLYRKYRPQTFAEVIGQEHIVQTLTNALSSGLISHAYLFGSYVIFFRPVYNFIVDVSYVLKIENVVAVLPEIFHDYIKSNVGSGVPQMGEIVNRRPANEKINLFFFSGLKDFLFS